jgi:hypothetical protein
MANSAPNPLHKGGRGTGVQVTQQRKWKDVLTAPTPPQREDNGMMKDIAVKLDEAPSPPIPMRKSGHDRSNISLSCEGYTDVLMQRKRISTGLLFLIPPPPP